MNIYICLDCADSTGVRKLINYTKHHGEDNCELCTENKDTYTLEGIEFSQYDGPSDLSVKIKLWHLANQLDGSYSNDRIKSILLEMIKS